MEFIVAAHSLKLQFFRQLFMNFIIGSFSTSGRVRELRYLTVSTTFPKPDRSDTGARLRPAPYKRIAGLQKVESTADVFQKPVQHYKSIRLLPIIPPYLIPEAPYPPTNLLPGSRSQLSILDTRYSLLEKRPGESTPPAKRAYNRSKYPVSPVSLLSRNGRRIQTHQPRRSIWLVDLRSPRARW